MPSGDAIATVEIEDRYVIGTRLRVRCVRGGRETIYKLTQKIPNASGGPGLITTIHLDAAEHAALCALPCHELRKTRTSIPPFGVDTFAAPLAGLVLAEVEFESAEELAAFAPSIAVVVEVTDDVRFTGGRLATASWSEVARDLAAFGVRG
jgi:CYTH domain-containing protein